MPVLAAALPALFMNGGACAREASLDTLVPFMNKAGSWRG
jgi:hypothetical protein